MNFIQRLFVIVGTPGSGKDLLIRAVHDLGVQHAQIVPKHTSRKQWNDDNDEMIFLGDPGYDLEGCNIIYQNYGDTYGIKSSTIWEGLRKGVFQVAVVSNTTAINQLREIFGELLVLVYVHSDTSAEKYIRDETALGKDPDYIKRRAEEYQTAFDIYLENFLAFNHVLIASDLPEDLYDQIFRLFRAYEREDLYFTAPNSPVSERILTQMIALKQPFEVES